MKSQTANFASSFNKNFELKWPKLKTVVQFRAEAFNLFNTPRFSNLDTSQSDDTFGQILSTSVAPRIFQFALKLNF